MAEMVNMSEYYLLWEPNNEKITPHRTGRRGSAITVAEEEIGSSDGPFTYASVILPGDFISGGKIKLMVTGKRWNYKMSSDYIYFKVWMDRIPKNPGYASLPNDAAVQTKYALHTFGYAQKLNIFEYNTPYPSWQAGDVLLFKIAVYSVRSDEEFAIHNMWLEYHHV